MSANPEYFENDKSPRYGLAAAAIGFAAVSLGLGIVAHELHENPADCWNLSEVKIDVADCLEDLLGGEDISVH